MKVERVVPSYEFLILILGQRIFFGHVPLLSNAPAVGVKRGQAGQEGTGFSLIRLGPF